MNKTVKIILIVFGCFLLLGLSVCGAGFVWLQSTKNSLKAEGDRLRGEAEAFAKTADQAACLTESLRRQDASCDPGEIAGAFCRGKEAAFFVGCLEHAAPTAGFCDDVPAPEQLVETVTWSIERCVELGRPNDQPCAKTVLTISRYCHQKPR